MGVFVCRALFSTVTNTNFDPDRLHVLIAMALATKRELRARCAGLPHGHGNASAKGGAPSPEDEYVAWGSTDQAEIVRKAYAVGVLSTANEDIRSLRETITYALQGLVAYTYHANLLDYFDDAILAFVYGALAAAALHIITLVHTGKIKRFIVIAGCDGRDRLRTYYYEVAEGLTTDSIILTAGCAKYRFMKLNLGKIVGIPRIIDAGQYNDCYSLVKIALLLMEAFAVKSIDDLPVSFDIAWYDQKAVAVLLSLLHLGTTGIRLGPTLPGFLSPNVRALLVERFGIRSIGTSGTDVEAMMAGR